MNILLIEDDSTEITELRATAKRLGEGWDINFVIKDYPNLSGDFYKDLFENKYDYIIADLKLEGDNEEVRSGNNFLKTCSSSTRIPIIINSSLLGDLDAELNIPDNPLVKQFNPTEANASEKIFTHIKNTLDTEINSVIGKGGIIESVLNDLIWKGHLNNIEKWRAFGDANILRKSLGRYILSHLHHKLSGDYEDFHSEETYIKIHNSKYDTGTVIKKDGKNFIILTPACDIANYNMDHYIISEIDALISTGNTSLVRAYDDYTTSSDADMPKKLNKFRSQLNSYTKATGNYTKFLPETSIFCGGFINFRKISIVPCAEINSYENICIVSAHFLKDIVADFGYYYSRQGQPNLSHKILIDSLRSTNTATTTTEEIDTEST